MKASRSRDRLISATIAAALVLAACSHQPTMTGSASNAPVLPDVVQGGGGNPRWVVFSPVGNASVGEIAAGFSTHMWASQTNGASGDNTIIRIGFDGSQLLINTPTSNSSPGGLTTGPDGDMWFAESNVGQLARISMPAGPVTEFPLLSASEQPIGVTTGADGNLWFIDANVGIVGKMTTAGAVTEYQLTHIQAGRGMTTGPDGNVWFAGFHDTSGQFTAYVGKITPAGAVTEYQIPGFSGLAVGITTAPDGNLWAAADSADDSRGFIVRVTSSGDMVEYNISGPPGSIARSGPHELAFTINNQPNYGLIGLDGTSAAHPLPGGSTASAFAVALGPDGNDWFSGAIGATSAVFVRIRLIMNVSPSQLSFSAPGQSQMITVSEQHYAGTWTAASSNAGIATVAQGNSGNSFLVTAVSKGTCTVTVSDKKGNSFPVPVSVQ